MGLAATAHHKSIRESNGSGAFICRKLEPLFMAQQRPHFWFWSVRRLGISRLNSFLVFLFSAGMLSPPSDPFVTNAERETIILLSVLVAWGSVHTVSECTLLHAPPLHRWASLGIKLASLARAHTDHAAAIHDILAGKYIEAAVSLAHLRVTST
jgi:hypothetical protein